MDRRAFAATLTLGILMVAGCDGLSSPSVCSEELASLDVIRQGRVSIQSIYPDLPAPDARARVTYTISSEKYPAADTEIRGLLDGTVKHHYNQGTAYHMRLGRRYSGAFEGQYELKRALVRWPLPRLVAAGRLASARCIFWVERFFDRSIQARGDSRPLHIYAYPIGSEWDAGQGGVNRDIFSEPAPGEASWLWAAAGTKEWPLPGALSRGEEDGASADPTPVALGVVDAADRDVVVAGPLLAGFVDRCLAESRSLDLLLKLDDEEEDRWGTQFALLTSNFGDARDAGDRRPRLELEVEYACESDRQVVGFTLERGRELWLPRIELRGTAILAGEIRSDETGVDPEIWVRGGAHGDRGGEWLLLDHPTSVDWDWYQARVTTAVGRTCYGEPFVRELREPWVVPGPREEQRPNFVLIAPSGRIHREQADVAPPLSYRFEFFPDEPGLWKYGWSFSPAPEVPAVAHRGHGLFYVDAQSPDAIAALARSLVQEFREEKRADLADQYRFNAFLRLAAGERNHGAARWQEAQRWIEEVRRVLPRELKK